MPWVYEDGTPVPPEQEALIDEDGRVGGLDPWSAAMHRGLGPDAGHAQIRQRRMFEAAQRPPQPPGLGRRLLAGGEALGTLGSAMVAEPVAALGATATLPVNAARHAMDPARVPPPEQTARGVRQDLRDAFTWVPETETGQRGLEALGGGLERNPALNPQYVRWVEEQVGQSTSPEAGELAGFLAHPLSLASMGPVRAGVRALARPPLRAMARSGERAAVRTLGAPPGLAGNVALSRGEAGMQALGREVQQLPGAALRKGPSGVYQPRGGSPLKAALEPVGQRLAGMAEAAELQGGRMDLGRVLSRFDAATAQLARDPMAGPRLQAVREYLQQTALKRGLWTPQGRQLFNLTPQEALAMRQGLDDVIYSAQTGLRRGSPLVEEFNRLRRIVDDELSQSISGALGHQAGLEWANLNRRYHDLADVRRLARAGYRRQAGQTYSPGQGRRRTLAGVPLPSVERPVQPSYNLMAAHARTFQPFSAFGF